MDIVTGEVTPEPIPAKDAAAVESGRRGGQIGGKARAEKLSPERRSEIAEDGCEAIECGGQQIGPADPYPRTPAMAAGIADHIRTCEEIAALLD